MVEGAATDRLGRQSATVPLELDLVRAVEAVGAGAVHGHAQPPLDVGGFRLQGRTRLAQGEFPGDRLRLIHGVVELPLGLAVVGP
jgi:hypothetical protein